MSTNPFDLLDQMFSPADGGFSEELCRFVLSLDFSETQKQRYLELAEKNNNGGLEPEDLHELESYVWLNAILGIMQSKARLSLRQQPAA